VRGRKPLSAVLHQLHGDPGRRPRQMAVRLAVERAHGHNGPDELPVAPAHLSAEQSSIFDYLVANAPRGILQPIDASLICCLSIALWLHTKAVARLNQEGLMVRAGPRSSRLVPNPYEKLATQQSKIILRLASALGFSPSDRARMGIRATEHWREYHPN
jgi:P27 family predicted phage terminase small subunit